MIFVGYLHLFCIFNVNNRLRQWSRESVDLGCPDVGQNQSDDDPDGDEQIVQEVCDGPPGPAFEPRFAEAANMVHYHEYER